MSPTCQRLYLASLVPASMFGMVSPLNEMANFPLEALHTPTQTRQKPGRVEMKTLASMDDGLCAHVSKRIHGRRKNRPVPIVT